MLRKPWFFWNVVSLALLWVVAPSVAADYSVHFGEVRGPSESRTIYSTKSIKFCDKPTGYRFGYEVIPSDGAAFELVTVFYLPAPANVTLKNAETSSGGKEVRTAPKTVTGRYVKEFNFDPGDPAGKWKIDVVVNNRTVQTIEFNVVPASHCP
jgi:hypothetical protein